jgi:hypothetical protein
MSTNLPTKWDEELAKHATKQAALERPAVGRLAFRGGVMTYQNQPIPGNKLNLVIVSTAKEHALYANVLENRSFDANKPENPVCYALALDGQDMIPHPQAKTRMAANCLECKYNQWGSAPNGGRGKACKESRRMVVLPQSSVLSGPNVPAAAGSVKKAEAATCSIPVTSVKNWANYTAQLAGEYRRPSWAMVTEMSEHPHAKTVFEIKFSPVALVDDSHLGDLMARVETANGIVMTPYSQETNAPAPQPMQNRKY